MIGHHVAVSGPGTTALYQGEPPLNLYYRPLQQNDYNALKAIHRDLFPIDYEEVFFQKAVSGEDRVFSWAAVHSQNGRDHLVGFVTARLVYMHECDPVDRQVMGLSSRSLDGCCGCYVLTLGVVPSCRQCGIARCLLGLVQQHAARLRCRAIFLHVISYNIGAMRLYGGAGYQAMARLPNFYHLLTGRQPDPTQTWFDAFLYALFLPPGGVLGASGGSGEVSPALQWAGGVIGAAVAPLRSVLGTFQGCVPAWLSRQTYSTFLPFAASAAALTSCKDQPRGAPPTPNGQRHQQQPLHQQWPLSAGPYPYMQQQQQQHVSHDPGAACLPYSPAGPQHPHQHPPQQQQLQQQQQRYSQECGPVSSQGWVPAGGNRRNYEAQPQAPNWPQALPWEQQGPGEAALPMPGPMQGGPMQQQQPAGEGYGPVLRPPSPLAPPCHAGRCATPQQQPPQQQAHPAAAGGGFGEAGVMPTYTAAGPGYCHPHPYQVQQQQQQPPQQQQYNDFRQRHGHGLSRSNSRNGYQHQKHPQQQQHQQQPHPSEEDGNGSAQGDLECSSSSSGAHRNPQGLGGSGLHMRPHQHQQHQQQHQQQHNQRQRQSGSLLTSLLRPPAAQPHLHSR